MRIDKFNGLNNKSEPQAFGLKGLTVAKNIDITKNKKIKSRPGVYRLTNQTIQFASHVGNELLFQNDKSLSILDKKLNVIQLKNDVLLGFYLVAKKEDGKIFWSNGAETGLVVNKRSIKLGIKATSALSHSHINGNMESGTYLYAVTSVREDGLESGCLESGVVNVFSGGFQVNGFEFDDGIEKANLYISSKNGENLYFAGSFYSGQAIRYIGDTKEIGGVPFDLMHCDQPPIYTSICFYMARAYYAIGNVIWFSLPFNYETVNYAENFIVFNENITFIESVNNGIYVSTLSAVYFLSGSDVSNFTSVEVLGYGGVRGTSIKVEKRENVDAHVSFLTEKGYVLGFDGGVVINKTENTFEFGAHEQGTSMVREFDGDAHYVVSLSGNGSAYNAPKIRIISHITSPRSEVIATG